MLKSSRLTAAPFIILLLLMSGCSIERIKATSPSPSPTDPAPSFTSSAAPSPSPLTNPFQDASDKAIGAVTISQSAQSRDDWNLVAGMWQEAITLMKTVPKSSSNYALAQKKVTEFERNLVAVKQNIKNPPSKVGELTSQTAASQAELKAVLTAKEAVSQIMESYIQATTIKGSNGHEFFCSDASGAETSFFAPRSAEILNISDEYESVGGGRGIYATLRIESSNRGGSPIINDWVFVMSKDPKVAKGLPGDWCISFIKDN